MGKRERRERGRAYEAARRGDGAHQVGIRLDADQAAVLKAAGLTSGPMIRDFLIAMVTCDLADREAANAQRQAGAARQELGRLRSAVERRRRELDQIGQAVHAGREEVRALAVERDQTRRETADLERRVWAAMRLAAMSAPQARRILEAAMRDLEDRATPATAPAPARPTVRLDEALGGGIGR